MARKRELKIELTGPLKATRATIKLIAEGYLDWMEEKQRKELLNEARDKPTETGLPRRKKDAQET